MSAAVVTVSRRPKVIVFSEICTSLVDYTLVPVLLFATCKDCMLVGNNSLVVFSNLAISGSNELPGLAIAERQRSEFRLTHKSLCHGFSTKLDSQHLEQFKAAGRNASLTVLPVRVGTDSMSQVGEVVGLLLERAGMKNVETSEEMIDLPIGADSGQAGKLLGEYVKSHPPQSDYTLFAEFRVSSKHTFVEVKSVIVDKQGELGLARPAGRSRCRLQANQSKVTDAMLHARG